MILQKSFEEIYQSIRNNINDRDQQIDSKPGTFISDVFVCPQADELAAFYADLKQLEINQSMLLASGQDLDRLCRNYFTIRQGATRATGTVRFYIKGTNREVISLSSLPAIISIDAGFVVATGATSASSSIEFVTEESLYVENERIPFLPTDPSTGYKYLETDIYASEAGSAGNVGSYAINTMITEQKEGIISVGNPVATVGGRDQEDDNSLRFRAFLSVLGASICTKNGYLKFIIPKENVRDALVVGGGDSLMFRDGGYLDAADQYNYGRGGMVDIWVRGQKLANTTTTYDISTSYLEHNAPDIVLPYQPVTSITFVQSETTGYTYDNAANYEVEYGTLPSGKTETKYYKDILWDFTITNSFPDLEYYDLDVIDQTEIEILKSKIDKELQDALDYMSNLNYSINWALVTEENISDYEQQPMFKKIYYNGKVYKIVTVDGRLNSRTFVKKDNRIYLRWYASPDYELVKTTYTAERYDSQLGQDIGGSTLSKDAIHWIKPELLQESDTLIISYNYNLLIHSLQTSMDEQRILTADILLREAKEVPIQIAMNVECDNTVTTTSTRNVVQTALTTYIHNYIPMGSKLEESQLAAMAREIPGVTYVDLNSVEIAKLNSVAVEKIQLAQNEYFTVKNIDVTVTTENTIS